jgi:hypothetical protein
VSLQSAVNFRDWLRDDLFWNQGDEYDFCIVDDPDAHGRGLRNKYCDDEDPPRAETVWQRTADFLG